MTLRAERWNSVQLAHCGRDVATPIEVASFTIRSVRCSTPKSAMKSESNDVENIFLDPEAQDKVESENGREH
jgi:hypothetical protein